MAKKPQKGMDDVRSLRQRTKENAALRKNNPKREALLGKQRVAQQNRANYLAKTDRDAINATQARMKEYKAAAAKKAKK